MSELFNVRSGDFHSVEELEKGTIPLVSCGALDNGIIGFYDPPAETIYSNLLTVAYNGDYPLMAKFHPYQFAAKDDVAVLFPREKMSLAVTLFIQLMLNREVWRHSYGRKLFKFRLEKYELSVPVTRDGKLDDEGIESWLLVDPLWMDVGKGLRSGLPSVRQATLALLDDPGH